jgi:hypothetical protein
MLLTKNAGVFNNVAVTALKQRRKSKKTKHSKFNKTFITP